MARKKRKTGQRRYMVPRTVLIQSKVWDLILVVAGHDKTSASEVLREILQGWYKKRSVPREGDELTLEEAFAMQDEIDKMPELEKVPQC